MTMDANDLIELARSNGFESVTEAITIAKKARLREGAMMIGTISEEIRRAADDIKRCAPHLDAPLERFALRLQTAWSEGHAAEIERLRAALEPFQRNVESLSISGALGHIDREDLWNARNAYTQSKLLTRST
jgi:hypothetical protein